MRARAGKRKNGGCSYANREEAEMMMMMTGEGKKGEKFGVKAGRSLCKRQKLISLFYGMYV